MASTADQIRTEIAELRTALENSIDDTHKTLYAEIRKVQERLSLVEGQLRGRAKSWNEVVRQVFASGAYEATLNRMSAMERGQTEIRRQLLEIEDRLSSEVATAEDFEEDDLD